MKILTFSTSNHSNSINAALASLAGEKFKSVYKPDADIEMLNINDFEMPIYSIDRETEGGVHQRARDFYGKIGEADGLIMSFAEYNGSYTSAWKNIYDWMSRINQKVYQDTPAVVLAATPGPRSGASVLQAVEMTAPFFGLELCGVVGVGEWGKAFDPSTKSLTREEDVAKLDEALAALAGKVG
ncbi:MAG: NADPH-dependent FMN reductase [Sphingomonadales bacterium]